MRPHEVVARRADVNNAARVTAASEPRGRSRRWRSLHSCVDVEGRRLIAANLNVRGAVRGHIDRRAAPLAIAGVTGEDVAVFARRETRIEGAIERRGLVVEDDEAFASRPNAS